jgi:hypothetical protein
MPLHPLCAFMACSRMKFAFSEKQKKKGRENVM